MFLGLSLAACGDRTPPSFLLVSVDALRADRVGVYSGRETTPFIDGLAASGTAFSNAFVPLPATDPSHASLLTGLHPLQHGVLTNAVALPGDVDTLAEILGAAGYYTMGVVSVAHLKRAYAFDQGFDAFSDTWDGSAALNDEHQRGAAATNASALELIDAFEQGEDRPFFLFVHYFDVHAPYVAHDATAPTVDDSMEALYDGEVRYVDERIAELHTHLASLGLAENLVTVVTADHGEQLGEHGFEGGHADIYRETLQVPLILSGPGIETAVRDENVSVMDVVPTIAELAGVDMAPALYGVSLLDRGAERPDLLVLGYPQYTRSLGLLSEERYYIRNLDPYYMHMVREEMGASGSLIAAEPVDATPGVYRLPLLSETDRIEPVYVTLEVELEEASCRASLSVRAEPRLEYFSEPVAFEESIRIHLPAITLRDILTVTVEPTDCVASVRYLPAPQVDIDAFRAGLTGSYDTQATKIWRELLTERKRRPGDELYRLDDDPGMSTNRLDSSAAAEERRALTARWLELAPRERRFETGTYTEEEFELLKSLGYLR